MRRGDPEGQRDSHAIRDSEARLDEAVGLARAVDLTVADALIAPVSQIRPATYLGKGKVEEIVGLITGHDIELVVMDCALSPIQQRNLEKAWNTKVLDRTGLILEIFGGRAKTKEGALQVELAHLNYQRSRLVRSWTHLERQRGGFRFMGGPGETQIEADRRLICQRNWWRRCVRRWRKGWKPASFLTSATSRMKTPMRSSATSIPCCVNLASIRMRGSAFSKSGTRSIASIPRSAKT